MKNSTQSRQGAKSQSEPSVEFRDAETFSLKRIALGIVIVTAVLLAYLPAIRGDFVYDDDQYLSFNPLISASDGLYRIWFRPSEWISPYPLVFTSYWIEYRLWGLSVEGYHLTNLLLHAANAILLMTLLVRWMPRGAFFAALFFAVHPVNVESVAWITERKDVLSGLFFLCATLAWLKFLERRLKYFYFIALIAFIAALLSKSVTATFPLVAFLLSIDSSAGGRNKDAPLPTRALLLRLAPFFALSLSAGLATAWWERVKLGGASEFEFSVAQRLLIAGRVPWFYLAKILWPNPLTLIYSRWTLDTTSAANWMFPALTAFGIAAALIAFLRNCAAWALAGLLYLAILSPALGFINFTTMIYSFAANHYQYLAGMVVFAVVGHGFARMLVLMNRMGRTLAVTSVTFVLLLPSLFQASHFKDNATLFSANLEKNPSSWLAHYNVGVVLGSEGKFSAAIEHYEQALAINPDWTDARVNMGQAKSDMGRSEEAMRDFEMALAKEPGNPMVRVNVGLLYLKSGNAAEAIAQFRKGLESNPNHARLMFNLGAALVESGDLDGGIEQFQRVLELQPTNTLALNNLGATLVRKGEFEEAVKYLKRALELDPGYTSARINLEKALAGLR